MTDHFFKTKLVELAPKYGFTLGGDISEQIVRNNNAANGPLLSSKDHPLFSFYSALSSTALNKLGNAGDHCHFFDASDALIEHGINPYDVDMYAAGENSDFAFCFRVTPPYCQELSLSGWRNQEGISLFADRFQSHLDKIKYLETYAHHLDPQFLKSPLAQAAFIFLTGKSFNIASIGIINGFDEALLALKQEGKSFTAPMIEHSLINALERGFLGLRCLDDIDKNLNDIQGSTAKIVDAIPSILGTKGTFFEVNKKYGLISLTLDTLKTPHEKLFRVAIPQLMMKVHGADFGELPYALLAPTLDRPTEYLDLMLSFNNEETLRETTRACLNHLVGSKIISTKHSDIVVTIDRLHAAFEARGLQGIINTDVIHGVLLSPSTAVRLDRIGYLSPGYPDQPMVYTIGGEGIDEESRALDIALRLGKRLFAEDQIKSLIAASPKNAHESGLRSKEAFRKILDSSLVDMKTLLDSKRSISRAIALGASHEKLISAGVDLSGHGREILSRDLGI